MNLTSRTFLACYLRSLKNNNLDSRAKQVVTEAANRAAKAYLWSEEQSAEGMLGSRRARGVALEM